MKSSQFNVLALSALVAVAVASPVAAQQANTAVPAAKSSASPKKAENKHHIVSPVSAHAVKPAAKTSGKPADTHAVQVKPIARSLAKAAAPVAKAAAPVAKVAAPVAQPEKKTHTAGQAARTLLVRPATAEHAATPAVKAVTAPVVKEKVVAPVAKPKSKAAPKLIPAPTPIPQPMETNEGLPTPAPKPVVTATPVPVPVYSPPQMVEETEDRDRFTFRAARWFTPTATGGAPDWNFLARPTWMAELDGWRGDWGLLAGATLFGVTDVPFQTKFFPGDSSSWMGDAQTRYRLWDDRLALGLGVRWLGFRKVSFATASIAYSQPLTDWIRLEAAGLGGINFAGLGLGGGNTLDGRVGLSFDLGPSDVNLGYRWLALQCGCTPVEPTVYLSAPMAEVHFGF